MSSFSTRFSLHGAGLPPPPAVSPSSSASNTSARTLARSAPKTPRFSSTSLRAAAGDAFQAVASVYYPSNELKHTCFQINVFARHFPIKAHLLCDHVIGTPTKPCPREASARPSPLKRREGRLPRSPRLPSRIASRARRKVKRICKLCALVSLCLCTSYMICSFAVPYISAMQKFMLILSENGN